MKKERTNIADQGRVKSATERTKQQYLQIMCDEIIEFQGAGRYDLTYVLSKELSWKVKQRSQNASIEEPQENIIVDQRKVLKIWEIFYYRAL